MKWAAVLGGRRCWEGRYWAGRQTALESVKRQRYSKNSGHKSPTYLLLIYLSCLSGTLRVEARGGAGRHSDSTNILVGGRQNN